MSFLDSPIYDDAAREFEEEPDDWEDDEFDDYGSGLGGEEQ